MYLYRHYSFDLWLTLIRSNPFFKDERSSFFHKYFNYRDKTLQEVQAIFRQVDLMCNAINECTGKNIDAIEMYLMVISMVNDHQADLAAIDQAKLQSDMDDLVFSHLPVIYCTDTPGVIEQLKQAGQSSVSILSNTGFISGKTLRKVLKILGIDHLFDFQIYSDETGLSKPNTQLFRQMISQVCHTRGCEVDRADIIHIGDNPRADAGGATAAGIRSLLINSNHLTISSLIAQ
ncbi:HAD family hydrolase [Hufsiella ginkgonis]|uniref:HAD-IA family hydrolase n=1 Tax=Hufsiella ginkgonis TaxID=2695274 RepID=A0A7K1XVH0_9SPHI|nr:HAD family hydrolase [Hufsiella ginkgonis]MXV14972.1 HAD-IA family hydrolase [Hufsiella ginkgonis]